MKTLNTSTRTAHTFTRTALTLAVAGGLALSASTAMAGDTIDKALSFIGETWDAIGIGSAVGTSAVIQGSSGPVIMKSLSVMGGAPLLGGGAALSAASLANDYIYSDCQDAHACDAAYYGNYAGAALGTAGSLTTVAVMGAGPVGLAAVGASIGGGMAAGATLLIAAPVAATLAVGGLVYWAFHD